MKPQYEIEVNIKWLEGEKNNAIPDHALKLLCAMVETHEEKAECDKILISVG